MHVRIMKILVLCALVCVGTYSANPVTGTDTPVAGESFKTNTIKMGDEQLLVVTAEDGTPVTTIDVFNDEDYEIEITQDGRKCRLSQVHDNSSCFEEVPLADNEPLQAVLLTVAKAETLCL